MDMKAIVRELIRLRTSNDYSQALMAKQLNLPLDYLKSIETNKRNPRLGILIDWLDYLGYEIEIKKKGN